MATPHTPHRGFDAGKQFSIAVSIVGVMLVVGHLAGQIGRGSASGWSLVIGAGGFVVGLTLALLFMILTRLDRVEQRIAGSGNGTSAPDEGEEDARGASD